MDLLLFLSMYSLPEEDVIHVREEAMHKRNTGFFAFLSHVSLLCIFSHVDLNCSRFVV